MCRRLYCSHQWLPPTHWMICTESSGTVQTMWQRCTAQEATNQQPTFMLRSAAPNIAPEQQQLHAHETSGQTAYQLLRWRTSRRSTPHLVCLCCDSSAGIKPAAAAAAGSCYLLLELLHQSALPVALQKQSHHTVPSIETLCPRSLGMSSSIGLPSTRPLWVHCQHTPGENRNSRHCQHQRTPWLHPC